MLAKQLMQEIQDLKLRGYTQTEIRDYYVEQGIKRKHSIMSTNKRRNRRNTGDFI